MSIFKSYGSCLIGADAHLIEVEVGTSKGLPQETIVGLAENVVRESKSRIRTAILQSNFNYPLLHYTINLAPADIKKNGSMLDLPIAVGVLGATQQLTIPKETIYLGELSLDGSLKPIPYAMPICYSLQKQFPQHKIILPKDNFKDVEVLENTQLDFFEQLSDIIDTPKKKASPIKFSKPPKKINKKTLDFANIIGLEHIKKALVLALIGKHNVLLTGPPGSGKSQLLKCLPEILNPLPIQKHIESSRIKALLGLDSDPTHRPPVESPHHTLSYAGMFGGGVPVKPGVISLAHNGILILDELPEFKRSILEGLRQPLEDKSIQISRVQQHMIFPANCQIFATMNPCPCGYMGSQEALCNCKTSAKSAYLSRISGPILDRFDMILEVPKVEFTALNAETHSDYLDSETMQHLHTQASDFHLQPPSLEELIKMYPKLFQKLFENKYISFRSLKHIIKIAISLCKLNGEKEITKTRLLEACQYRKTHMFDLS